MKVLPVILCVTLVIASCLKEDDLKQDYKGFAPPDIGDGWKISSSSQENIDSVALDGLYRRLYADDETWMTKSLLVFRNGRLVAESYLKDQADRTRRDTIWSCTKQVNSIITGIAVDSGLIASLNDPLEKYLPSYTSKYPDKKDITLNQLLTMNSGIDFDNGNQNDILRNHGVSDCIDYVMKMPMAKAPGTFFKYKDCDPLLLSAVVQQATGKPLDEFGKQVLFDRLGIQNYEWARYTDGVTLGSWGIQTTPRELAKIGQCILDGGRFGNKQVIPSSWLEQMLHPYVLNAHNDLAFGYLWWIIPDRGWYFMWGHGGQYVYIIPEKQLLVVISSLAQVDDDVNLPVETMIGIAKQVAETAY